MAIATRRVGAESSATRALILEATEQLMRDQGYAAVSTRRVATQAGLKPSLVHYYFPTTDDLLLAVFRKGADEGDAMLEQALASPDPLRALWTFFAEASRTSLAMEFMAMANHRKAIKAVMAQHSEEMRVRQVEVLSRAMGQHLFALGRCPPAGATVVLAGIARVLVMEGALGVTSGHAEARAFVELWLERLGTEESVSVLP